MLVKPSGSPRTAYFYVEVYEQNSSSLRKGTGVSRSVSNSLVPNIPLGMVAFNVITLSGHIDFKINNVTPQNMWLEAYSSHGQTDDNYMGEARIDSSSGNWSITMDAPESSTTVYFYVYVRGQDKSRSYDTGQSQSNVYQTNISGIELGPVYKTLITLSGMATGTVDGGPPSGCMVAAYIAGEDKIIGDTDAEPDGRWSREVEAQASSKTVSFIVAPIVDESFVFIHLPSSYTVYNSPVSGINLTAGNITTKTIQVTITSNGATPEPGYVYICNSQIVADDMNSDDGMLKIITMPMEDDPDSSWTLKVPSDTGNVYFLVMTESGYYASTTGVSSDTTPVTLNLSVMNSF
jgi:hypothetical protein